MSDRGAKSWRNAGSAARIAASVQGWPSNACSQARARVAANLVRKFQIETSGTGSVGVLTLAEALA